MSRQPNPKETALIDEVRKAIEKYKKPDRRAGGDFYFSPECVPVFQDIARKVAIVIADQGTKDTCGPILGIAAEIKKLDDIEWNHAGSIGCSFERGVGADVVMTGRTNPMSNMKLPPIKM